MECMKASTYGIASNVREKVIVSPKMNVRSNFDYEKYENQGVNTNQMRAPHWMMRKSKTSKTLVVLSLNYIR